MSDEPSPKVVPAQLNFLAIYNPSLAEGEDNERDQIAFYFSRHAKERRRGRGKQPQDADQANQEENEHLRRIGLAQGMVNFAKTFSNEQSIDSVETDKHRIVLDELENGWWILASIDLTILPKSKLRSGSLKDSSGDRDVEYSAREVSPPAILLGQLLRAHRIFLIHHAPSLSELYVRTSLAKFCDILDIFWTRFCRTWDVLLHGNPSVDIYSGVKLAAGGELGIGVGEEEWGSGEREVLEGLVRHTEGLVDLTVTRFGNVEFDSASAPAKLNDESGSNIADTPWLGGGQLPGAGDGLLFSGLGMITRPSLRDLCDWTQTIFTLGENAYGIKESPGATRRKRRQRDLQMDAPTAEEDTATPSMESEPSAIKLEVADDAGPDGEIKDEEPHKPTIPPPIALTDQESSVMPTAIGSAAHRTELKSDPKADSKSTYVLADPELWKTVFTLGYGTAWGKSTTDKESRRRDESKVASSHESGADADANESTGQPKSEEQEEDTKSDEKSRSERNAVQGGRFLIGLRGNLSEHGPANEPQQGDSTSDDLDWNNRMSIRTLHLAAYDQIKENQDEHPQRAASPASDETIKSAVDRPRPSSVRRLRVVVYVNQPFIFTLLFDPNTSSLSYRSLFYELHRNLQPLHKPLLVSTCPENVASRLRSALNPRSNSQDPSSRPPILDLIYDPTSFTIRTSIPNIPMPGTLAAEGLHSSETGSSKDSPQQSWTRLAALNVHSQIINTYVDTRRQHGERERTAKTSRGWWVLWMRLPSTTTPGATEGGQRSYKEAVLVRKSGEQSRHGPGPGGRFGGRETAASGLGRLVGVGGGDDAASWNPVRIAEGIGVDARRYVENLLSLSR